MSRKAIRVFNWKDIFYFTIYDDGGYIYEWNTKKFIDWYNKHPNIKEIRSDSHFYREIGHVAAIVYYKYLKDE